MPYPLHFTTPTDAEAASIRVSLDKYGFISHLSPLAPIAAYLAFRTAAWLYRERFTRKQRTDIKYTALSVYPVPNSAKRSVSRSGTVFLRKLWWWFGSEIFPGWGRRGLWIAALVWVVWLGGLAVWGTGGDYKHVTKRFAIVAVAQMPWQYLASMRWRYSPLILLFGVSHQEIQPYHRALGRIVYAFFAVHAAFYMNVFVQKGIVSKVLGNRAVITGTIAIIALSALMATSITAVRHRSYRVFYFAHFVIGSALPLVLLLHTSHLRIYVLQTIFVLVLDKTLRRFGTVSSTATISQVANSQLLRVDIPLPEKQTNSFRKAPGSHVYLSMTIPAELRIPLSNPFSVQAANHEGITLMIRPQNGRLTQALKTIAISEHPTQDLRLEGPYGSARHFPNLATEFSRTLLVAGGVGATFILPVHAQIQHDFEEFNMPPRRSKMIWIAKTTGDVEWASSGDFLAEGSADVDVYLTGRKIASEDRAEDGLETSSETNQELVEKGGWSFSSGRPDLQVCVDEFLEGVGEDERAAVLVCGPPGLVKDLGRSVGRWVSKGKDVWWHEEHFS